MSVLPVAAAPDPMLNWPGKPSDTAPKAGQYGVPPSPYGPYGEVGGFFKKDLNWAGKSQSQTAPKAQPAAPQNITPVAPVAARTERPAPYVPEPATAYIYRPRSVAVAPQAAPVMTVASVNAPALPAPQPRLTPEALRELEAAGAVRHASAPAPKPATAKPIAKPVPPPVTMAPIPNPKPATLKPAPVQAVAAKPVEPAKPETKMALTPSPSAAEQTLTVAPDPDAYHIPPTSKYYRGPAVAASETDSATTDPKRALLFAAPRLWSGARQSVQYVCGGR
ncbi:hypothetical protein OVA03_14440 [Asticcacaulis sp. SL142]|uniref:hypothetical protein n=1 Tax=Asticcacaulis sp. SL142 TaxID=2995155 RepID=UPI00226D2354|nr:hypothetical protein [Asticcacaulis sp. SL142]WAC47887.1 hypothetical protein OVA03_14440 [Asticcacaulis sp. SL142]